ncbi:4-vinyl reductase [Eubacteriales bacterium OttesenSCG-928-N14]|nr:4-vinyl reductase [Eubacteriales bacterium OttesenSCG-928-N14]
MADEKHFSWKDIGDIELGRENLGTNMPVAVYRLLQFSIRDVLLHTYGYEQMQDVFRKAGEIAGREFAHNMLDLSQDFNGFISELQQKLKDLQIGILRIERSDLDNLHFTLTVAEDLDCSGLDVTDETVCDYDEGFIAGILQSYTDVPFTVREIDCWANGARVCRFDAKGGNES